jgi:hypothetical protein
MHSSPKRVNPLRGKERQAAIILNDVALRVCFALFLHQVSDHAYYTPIFQFLEFCKGSFSAVSSSFLTSNDSFFGIFCALSEENTSEKAKIVKIRKESFFSGSSWIFSDFFEKIRKIADFSFCSENLILISEAFSKHLEGKSHENCVKILKLQEKSEI